MFSLIITIVSIVLVAALAVATLYYGGTITQQASTNAKAAAYITQGQQVLAAAQMFHGDKGYWPDSVDQLVELRYLTGAPQTVGEASGFSLISSAYAAPAMPAKLPWAAIVPRVPQYWMKGTVPKKVCQSINQKTRGDDAIYAEAVVGLHTQCFGATEPYTAVVYAEATDTPPGTDIWQSIPSVDPSLTVIDADDTPTVVVESSASFPKPAQWSTSASGAATISLINATPGMSIWGASYTPATATSPIYVPVSIQPLPTPGGWTPPDTSKSEIYPRAPTPIAATFVAWWDYGNVGNRLFPTAQEVCDARRVIINWSYLGYVPNTANNGACVDSYNRSMGYPKKKFWCPVGYGFVYDDSSDQCIVVGSNQPKPSDGMCPYVRGGQAGYSSITYTKDANDPDCPAVQPPLPTACSSSGGTDPVVRVNNDGTVTLTQYYGGCGASKSVTCTTTSTNKPGYYQPAQIGPVNCS